MDLSDDAVPSSRPLLAAKRALQSHPAVTGATVVQLGSHVVALVVPDKALLDQKLEGRSLDTSALRRWKKTYDLNQSTKAAASAPLGFNTVGWDSTYTRQPLPPEDMREWVGTSVDSILQLGAKRIYEIGCGTGMLLMRIAPECNRYVAADFSHEVLCRVQEQLQRVPATAARVELTERSADNFDGLEPDSFDAVVINSAAQYFPSAAYLEAVLKNALRLVRDGGEVFIGDGRSLPLLPAFGASVELFQAADHIEAAELRDAVSRRLRNTPELVLSPAWFADLLQRIPGKVRVEIGLRRGRADNEMTRYRYNTVLHAGADPGTAHDIPFEEWSDSTGAVDQIRSMARDRKHAFGISRVPNARIEKDLLALEILRSADGSRTAASIRSEVEQAPARGVHPQDLFDLEAMHPGMQVRLSWAAARCDGSYDALIVPADSGERDIAVRWPEPDPSSLVCFANAPGRAKVRGDLVEELLAHCRQTAGTPSVPDRIALVDAIPSTARDAMAWAENSGFDLV
jgi:SAM-dependent methyltransferase